MGGGGGVRPPFDVVHFLSRPQRRPASKLLKGMVPTRLSWRLTFPEPYEFPSLCCPKSFLWAHKEVDLSLHPVVGPVLPVGNRNLVSSGILSPLENRPAVPRKPPGRASFVPFFSRLHSRQMCVSDEYSYVWFIAPLLRNLLCHR